LNIWLMNTSTKTMKMMKKMRMNKKEGLRQQPLSTARQGRPHGITNWYVLPKTGVESSMRGRHGSISLMRACLSVFQTGGARWHRPLTDERTFM
jgi:hypothetical protein